DRAVEHEQKTGLKTFDQFHHHFFFSSRRRHTRSVSAFLLNRSSDLSRNRRRLKANQTGKKFRVGIKSNISTNRNNLISGVDRCIHLNAMKKTTITSINRQTIKI